MFEGVVAAVLNRFLGKYVQDLDTENLNVGIFGGDVQLHNLRIRPEALYELDLPIEVKAGTIGRVALNIPWSGLYTESVIVTIEDVYVVAGPVLQGPYDPERDKRLLRAAKRRHLDDTSDWLGMPDTGSFLENLITTVMNNLQVFIRNVHIRYEDTTMHPDPNVTFTCGICLFNLSVEFTNSKWKPCPSSPGATSVYQLIRIESFSVYVNKEGRPIIGDQDPEQVPFSVWREDMERGLKQFNTGADPLKFMVQPVSAKVKVIVNRSNEARVPKLLVDFVVEDVSLRLTRDQYTALRHVRDSLQRQRVAWRFRSFRPAGRVGQGGAAAAGTRVMAWWRYALEAVLEQRVRPYTWSRVRRHRDVYARYRDACARALLQPADTELKLDLQQLEDQLDVVDILVAREHAKLQLHRDSPGRVAVAARAPSRWQRWFPGGTGVGAGTGGGALAGSRSPSPELQVRAERPRGLWAQLSGSERDRLYEAIGYAEGTQRPEKPKQYIEHKLNVTLVNCSLSLVSDVGEVLASHLTHLLVSLETRPAAAAYKVSLRIESAVVEGASLEHHLVPLATANVNSGNNYSNFLAIDFEKHPSKTDADFGLSITMEPMEIVYHEHAVSELLTFFCSKRRPVRDLCLSAGLRLERALKKMGAVGRRALTRRNTYCLSVDVRGPYIVIPESGSMQKGGQVLVLDAGRVMVRTELQPPGLSLEDATQMELEERLYDRLHVECSEAQVLFCDSGDEWWESRKLQDSELHLVPKVRGQIVFSNSVRPEYRALARHKLTVSLASVKLNLSDRRVGMALDFLENVPAPAYRPRRASAPDGGEEEDEVEQADLDPLDHVTPGPSGEELARVRSVVRHAAVRAVRGRANEDGAAPKLAALDLDKSFMSSDHSDSEELELWARTVDLPGFDDNVSPHNAITMLLRFVVGEVVVNLARSSNRVDKPYLLLRLGKLCWDSALMEYGPAVQASVGSVQLVDRLHAAPQGTGQYLEMVSTAAAAGANGAQDDDVLSLLYRKVKSNCPDFKSHFHSVEQSLVVDVATVNLVFHQEAFITLNKYLQYTVHKFQSRDGLRARVSSALGGLRPSLAAAQRRVRALWCGADDPPIPQGATKFSYSTRAHELRVRLCDTDLDFMDIRVTGLESDCLFKANERMVLRTHLTGITCEDLSDVTLYHRVLQVDDDRVLDLKYVRHSPRLYQQSGLAGRDDDVKSDGSLKVRLGRLSLVLLYKTVVDLQQFVEPLLRPGLVPHWLALAGRLLDRAAGRLRTWPTRLHVSLDLHLPALLLPQKSASPNLVVANLGDLTVENFFKEVAAPSPDGSGAGPPLVIDNILVRLDNVQLSRAVMTLAGALHVQEPILEPLSLRLDIKRLVASPSAAAPGLHGPGHGPGSLLYDVSGGMDLVRVNLGQRDLATLLAVWCDNLAEGRFIDISDSQAASPLEPASPSHGQQGHAHGAEDQTVRRLQQFFAQNEQGRRESSVRLTLDGVQLALFGDVDEILSSPVRDLNHGLCRLELGEASVTLDTFTDRSLELRTSLLTCVLEDIRPERRAGLSKIFQSHAGETRRDSSSISVSQPPIVDLTFRQTQAGDRSVDVLVEQTRLNLTVGFLAAMARFLLDALPGEGEQAADGVHGFVNQGYVGDLGVQHSKAPGGAGQGGPAQRPPSSEDSTSGCFSSRASCCTAGGGAGDQAGLVVSLQLRRPEVFLAPEPDGHDQGASQGHGLLLRTEVTLDYNRHSYRETLNCSLASLRVLALPTGPGKRPCHQVLFPCDIEFTKSFKTVEDGVKVIAGISPVDIHLCASTVRAIMEVVEDINAALQPDEPEPAAPTASAHVPTNEPEDLWSAKKLQPYVVTDPCEGLMYTGAAALGSSAYTTQEYIPESMTLAVPKVRVVLELEADNKCTPVVLVRAAADAHVKDWSTQLHLRAELQLQASYVNGDLGLWEPLLEPVVEAENVFRPWELHVRLFRAKAFPISSRVDTAPDSEGEGRRRASARKRSAASHQLQLQADDSQTSGEETEPEHSMTFIRRPRSDCGQDGQVKESASMGSYHDDSDSEDEDGVMEKLAGAIGYLFSGDSSEGEASESDESSIAEPSGATEEASEMETPSAMSTVIGQQERAVFLTKQSDSVDSGLEAEPVERHSNYLLIQAKDRLELTVTPAALRAMERLRASFTFDPVNNNLRSPYPPLSLCNNLGSGATALLTTKAEKGPDGEDKVLAKSPDDETESAPGTPHASPSHQKYLDYDVSLYAGVDGVGQDGSEDVAAPGVFYCNASHQSQEVLSPVMRFPPDTISDLYKKITDLRLTVNVEGFEPIHVLCPKRSCHKLHALLPARNNIRYHIMMDVESTCQYRRVTIRSPLQIRNETTFSIGLYYKKSVFDGLGLPHVGESTNPFDDSIFFMNLEPDKVCDVPLHVAYNCKIHFHPAYYPFHASESGLWWKDLGADMNTAKDYFCAAKDEKDSRAFSCRVVCAEGAPVKQTYRSIPNYLLRLLPPLQFYNGLPFAVELKVPSIAWEQRVEAGDRVSQYFLNLQRQHRVTVEVPAYLGLAWAGSFNLTPDLEEKTVTMTTEQDTEGGNKQLGVTVRVDRSGTCVVYLHAPYWVVNKTGLPLQLRGSLSDVVYDVPAEEALLFSFRKVRRRCVRLRAYHSSWSSAFSLDTVDTNGLVVCRDRERRRHYRILQSVQLSSGCPQLTKIVTLLPNLIVYNRCRRPLRFMEENERADLWIDLAPDKCQPFWPVTDSMRMLVKYRDSKLVSQHFPVTQTHTTVLRMDRGTGLVVEVTGGGDMPFAVVFRAYCEGDAPLRVDNLCEDLFLKVHQQDLGQVALLSPYQSMLYTWDDPSRERCLLWNVYNKKSKGFVADFWKDGYGQERVCFHSVRQPPGSASATSGSSAGSGPGGGGAANNSAPTSAAAAAGGGGVTSKLSAGLKLLTPRAPKQDGGSSSSDDTESDDLLRSQQLKRTRRDKVVVFWVSYLEAHQRVLLFTQDERVALSARKRIQSERSHLEAFLSLGGVGVSLLAATAHGPTRELAYLSLTDSAAVWEVCMAHRWKPLSLELASWIEDKWRHDHKRAQMKEYVHVDFEKMYMTKPFYGELRRRYNPAFWMQLRRSEHLTYCRMSIHRLQLDNQQPGAHFPTVLCPTPGAGAAGPGAALRQQARRALLKPCVDLLVLRRARPAQRQHVYKYVKVVVQELSVQLERDFLDALHASWTAATARPGRAVLDDDQHHLLESLRQGLRQDVARSYIPVHFVGVKLREAMPRPVIESVHLSPLRLRLSLFLRGSARTGGRSLPGKRAILDHVFNALVPSAAEIKNVRLKLPYFERKGVQATCRDVAWDARRHYYSQLVQQVHVLVLGLDVLGNPYGLVSDFTDGFGEFFYEPHMGTIESPDEFAEDLSRAAQALLGNLTGAEASGLSLLAPSLGAMLTNLTFEDEYKKKRRYCLQQATDLPELARAASKTFSMGVLMGLSGVVLKPSLGAPQEGVEGFFRGTGKGFLGLMTKPGGGVVDCIATAHDGIRRATEMGEDMMMRTRLPRHLNPFQGLRPFSVYEATGQHLLSTLSRGHYADSDLYWAHAALAADGKTTMLITLQHVFLLERCRQWGPIEVEWAVRVDDIMEVPKLEHSKLVFKVRQDDSFSAFSGDERSVTSEDPAVLAWLRDKVETVLVLNMEDRPVPATT